MSVAKNIEAVRKRIIASASLNQRSPEDITLLAVSKKHPHTAIEAAHASGQRHFGENYLQEALSKIETLSSLDIIWHFIGPIQSNKTRSIANHFDWVHTIDRIKVAERLSSQRPPELAPLNICIQVNIDDEESKSGIPAEEAIAFAQQIHQLPRLRLRGLMAIPRLIGDNEGAAFQRMNTLFNQCKHEPAFEHADTLSMGMSGDLELAIANGANIVRIGTDIFGPRQ